MSRRGEVQCEADDEESETDRWMWVKERMKGDMFRTRLQCASVSARQVNCIRDSCDLRVGEGASERGKTTAASSRGSERRRTPLCGRSSCVTTGKRVINSSTAILHPFVFSFSGAVGGSVPQGAPTLASGHHHRPDRIPFTLQRYACVALRRRHIGIARGGGGGGGA